MEEKKSDSDKKNNLYLRFTSVVMQMGAVIGGFSWLGVFLDNKYQLKTPIWTIILALFGVFISMYLIFKEVKNINKD